MHASGMTLCLHGKLRKSHELAQMQCSDCSETKIWASSQENMLLLHANIKGEDRPEQKRSVISAFVINLLGSILSKLASSKFYYSS